MPHSLKLELLPLEQYLLPHLLTIMGNVDYQTLRAQLLRIYQLLVGGGIERDFIAGSVIHRSSRSSYLGNVSRHAKHL